MGESAESSPVEVRVRADLGQLPVLRALAETVALFADFTLDEVADIRLAVDEVASILILEAVPDSTLSSEFIVSPTRLLVRVTASAQQRRLPDQNSFGWHVLRTLTDTLEATPLPFDPEVSGYPTVIEFSRARGNVSAG